MQNLCIMVVKYLHVCFFNAPKKLLNHKIHKDVNFHFLCLFLMCSQKSSQIRGIFHTGDSSVCNLSHPYNCLGGNLHFPAKLLFSDVQLKKFWAWAEIKTGLCWGRITAKASDKFQTFGIFNMFTCWNPIPSFVLAIGIMGLNMNMWTCWISKMFETRQMGKVVQHCENTLNHWPD